MAGALIHCPSCKQETFLRREPVYEGFEKVGETLSCVGCGYRFASEEEVVFVESTAPKVFTDADRTTRVDIFHSDEKGHNCRHCKHFVKNPFVQRCGLHHMEVQASDCCQDFTALADDEDDAPDGLSGLFNK